ncbi:MAG: alpha/beta hydrolase, partial [Pseudomonadota bacterium]
MISSKENKARDFPLRNPDYNPMPEPHTAGYATCPDGVKLRYAVWLPAQENAKGTILFLPGRTEVIEKGYETIRDFQAKGFAVLSFDWRGQGGSDRLLEDPEKGYVDEFDEYVMDLETIINDVALPDCRAPFYIVAHSMGALISMLAAPRFPNKIRRMVLCSTFLGIGNQRVSAGTIKLVTGAMTALGLGDMVIGRGRTSVEKQKSSDSFLTADIDRLARNNRFIDENPDLSIGAPTASWIFAAGKAIDQVLDPDFT